jgi:hypothetical protein
MPEVLGKYQQNHPCPRSNGNAIAQEDEGKHEDLWMTSMRPNKANGSQPFNIQTENWQPCHFIPHGRYCCY